MKNISLRYHGFTLIECIVTILILSILSATIVARWPSNTITVNGQAQQVASAIRYTQALALSHAQSYRIQFTNASYSISDLNGNVVTDPVTNQSTTTLPSTMTYSWTNLPNNLLAFSGQGIPYTDATGNTTALASTATVVVSSGNTIRTISAVPQTGRVSIA